MTEHVKIQENGAVLEILFARPEKKNALSNAMYRAASDALESARTNKNVRVVLFGAEGASFTAGNDLADFAAVAREHLQSAYLGDHVARRVEIDRREPQGAIAVDFGQHAARRHHDQGPGVGIDPIADQDFAEA